MKQNRNVNLLLIIIGILGFFFFSFFMIYRELPGGFLLTIFFMILFLEAYILRIQLPEKKPVPLIKNFHQPIPLSSGFMITSIIGALIALFIILPLSLSWGVSFTLIFTIMFIASIVSMTQAPVADEALIKMHMDELAIHKKIHKKRNPK